LEELPCYWKSYTVLTIVKNVVRCATFSKLACISIYASELKGRKLVSNDDMA